MAVFWANVVSQSTIFIVYFCFEHPSFRRQEEQRFKSLNLNVIVTSARSTIRLLFQASGFFLNAIFVLLGLRAQTSEKDEQRNRNQKHLNDNNKNKNNEYQVEGESNHDWDTMQWEAERLAEWEQRKPKRKKLTSSSSDQSSSSTQCTTSGPTGIALVNFPHLYYETLLLLILQTGATAAFLEFASELFVERYNLSAVNASHVIVLYLIVNTLCLPLSGMLVGESERNDDEEMDYYHGNSTTSETEDDTDEMTDNSTSEMTRNSTSKMIDNSTSEMIEDSTGMEENKDRSLRRTVIIKEHVTSSVSTKQASGGLYTLGYLLVFASALHLLARVFLLFKVTLFVAAVGLGTASALLSAIIWPFLVLIIRSQKKRSVRQSTTMITISHAEDHKSKTTLTSTSDFHNNKNRNEKGIINNRGNGQGNDKCKRKDEGSVLTQRRPRKRVQIKRTKYKRMQTRERRISSVERGGVGDENVDGSEDEGNTTHLFYGNVLSDDDDSDDMRRREKASSTSSSFEEDDEMSSGESVTLLRRNRVRSHERRNAVQRRSMDAVYLTKQVGLAIGIANAAVVSTNLACLIYPTLTAYSYDLTGTFNIHLFLLLLTDLICLSLAYSLLTKIPKILT
eukprot:g2737.t1